MGAERRYLFPYRLQNGDGLIVAKVAEVLSLLVEEKQIFNTITSLVL